MKRFTDLKVYIVDDDPAVLDSLVLLLSREPLTLQTYDNCQAFLDQYDPEDGGCLVLDVGLPGMNGLELQKRLLQTDPLIPIVFITGNADVPQVVQALRSGAVDFIEKPFALDNLLNAIHRGLTLSYERLQKHNDTKKSADRLSQLTQRERQVLQKIVDGKANKVIAYELGISQRTVEIHRANIMQKMQISSLAELVKSCADL